MREAFNYDFVKEKIKNELNSDKYNTFDDIKDDVKNFLIKHHYINSVGTIIKFTLNRKFWEQVKLGKILFEEYDKFQNQYIDKIEYSEFIRLTIFNIKLEAYDHHKLKYKSLEDYIKRGNRYPPSPGHVLVDLNKEIKKVINFIPKSFQELKYCVEHNVKEPNKCLVCGKHTKFLDNQHGYKVFCSKKCQIHYQNKEKEPRFNLLDDDELRKIICNIAPNRRNLTSSKIANMWINIDNYSKKWDMELTNPEKIYVFLNKITKDDIICPYCKKHKKLFRSQVLGFRPTCGEVNCIKLHKGYNVKTQNETTMSDLFNKNIEYGFIYLLQINNTKIFKIGISKNVFKRFNCFRDIKDIKIICSVMIKDYKMHEKILHEHFKDKQMDFNIKFDGYSEFFNLNQSDLEYFKNYVNNCITLSIDKAINK